MIHNRVGFYLIIKRNFGRKVIELFENLSIYKLNNKLKNSITKILLFDEYSSRNVIEDNYKGNFVIVFTYILVNRIQLLNKYVNLYKEVLI